MKKWQIACGVLVVLAAVARAAPPILDLSHVAEKTLDNGLHVVVKHEPYWGMVAAGLHIRCGSVNDPEGKVGIAHLIEHLLFRSKGRGDRGLGSAIEELGGYINAQTLQDFTAVEFLVASPHFSRAVELLGEQLRGFRVDARSLEREKQVVLREIAERGTDAATVAEDLLWMTALKRHPYRWPAGGTEETLRRIGVDDVMAEFRRFYVPNNMALIVVGDVKPEEAFRAAERAFGDMKARPIDWQPPPDEPFPDRIRTKVVTRPSRATLIAIGLQAPGMDNKREVCAMDLIYTLLGDGQQAWLNQYLVREKHLALGATCDFLTHRHPGMLIISAVCRPDKEVQVRQAIIDKLENLRREPLRDDELERVKDTLYTSYAFTNETYVDQVGSIGFYEMIDTYKFAFEYIDIVRSITAEELRAVALKYLDPNRRAVVIMRPRRPGQQEARRIWPLG